MKFISNHILSTKKTKPFLVDVHLKHASTAKPVVIFCHGFKGFKDWGCWNLLADEMAEAGFIFVKFNFSMNGTTIDNPTSFADTEAFGNNNYSKEIDDLDEVINWVCSQNKFKINHEIYLIGHSRGGGCVLTKASLDNRVKKVITLASISSYNRFGEKEQIKLWKEKGVWEILNGRTGQKMPLYYQFYEDYQSNKDILNLEKNCKVLKKPCMIIHGTNDPAVSFESALDLHHWVEGSELISIENGNHVFGSSHPWDKTTLPKDMIRIKKAIISFLNE